MLENQFCFRIEFLPADIVLDLSKNCRYQVRCYEVIRETNNFIWVRKVDSRFDPAKLFTRKYNKKDFFKYGRFVSMSDALDYIEKMYKDIIDKLNKGLKSATEELQLFRKENEIEISS
jgi:hypothetical protein